jgi:hypothetical protein
VIIFLIIKLFPGVSYILIIIYAWPFIDAWMWCLLILASGYASLFLNISRSYLCKCWWFIISEVHSILHCSLFAENVLILWIALHSSPCAYYVGLHLQKIRLCTLLEVLMLVTCFSSYIQFYTVIPPLFLLFACIWWLS